MSVHPSVRAMLVKKSSNYVVLSDRNVVRAMVKTSRYLYCPCPTVAASVGRVSGLVHSLNRVFEKDKSDPAFFVRGLFFLVFLPSVPLARSTI